jgi:hypothetical protein
MSGRPSVSRVRENRTHGLKGGWGNRAYGLLHPLLPMIASTGVQVLGLNLEAGTPRAHVAFSVG